MIRKERKPKQEEQAVEDAAVQSIQQQPEEEHQVAATQEPFEATREAMGVISQTFKNFIQSYIYRFE